MPWSSNHSCKQRDGMGGVAEPDPAEASAPFLSQPSLGDGQPQEASDAPFLVQQQDDGDEVVALKDNGYARYVRVVHSTDKHARQ